MPITIALQPDQQLVIFRHVGDVADEELLAFYEGFFDRPDANDYLNLLIDLEQTTSVDRSSQALRSLASILQEKLQDSSRRLRAAVIAPADHSFGMARMYEVFSGRIPWDFVVLRDADAALAWLDVGRGSEDQD